MRRIHVTFAMHKKVAIKAVQAFEAASRLGSFAAAAEELAVTPSAISHQIRLLEDRLGVRLFHRVHRSVVLTEIGRRYASELRLAFARIETATQRIASAGANAILSIHSTPSFATQWLMPRLAEFRELHKNIDIRLKASVDQIDLTKDEIDVDIRYNSGRASSGTVQISFPDDIIVPMASPALVNGLKPIREPEDLKQHQLIHSEVNIVTWRDWARAHKIFLDLDKGPRFDRSFMSIRAAVDGLGICLDSLLLAEQELRSGRLIIPFPTKGIIAQGHSLFVLKESLDVPNVRLFNEWLTVELKKSRRWQEKMLGSVENS